MNELVERISGVMSRLIAKAVLAPVLAATLAVPLLPASASHAAVSSPARSASASADLQVTMVDAPDPARYVEVWASYTYTITVTNAGPDTAVGVKADFTILNPGSAANYYGRPSPFVQGIIWPSQGTCHVSGGQVGPIYYRSLNCELGSLASGSDATITVEVRAGRHPPLSPGASESFTNVASASSDTDDPVSSNNSVTETTTIVQGYADLSVSMTPSPNPLLPGQDRTFTILLRNDGPDAVTAFLDFGYPGSGQLDDRVTSVAVAGGDGHGFCPRGQKDSSQEESTSTAACIWPPERPARSRSP